jgi:hypothetical protein
MVNGEGYWLKMAGNRVYTWNGTVQGGILYPKLNYVPRSPFNGALGWNLIGSYEYIADPNFVRTAPENKRTGFIFEYTPGTGYQVAASLNPGKGYWIQLTAAAEIYIPGPYSGTLSKSPADEYINKDWGRITITDAQGSNYVLYTVTENGINLDIFNLPPLPPANQFDVRFGSQRFVENLNGQTQMLNLTGVVYPVTIKADGINLHLEDPITGKIINTNIADGKEFTLNDSRLNVLKVSSDKITPNRYSLEQNYPNPFNPSTVIKFSVPSTSIVKLTIYNALGQKVSELVNSVLEAGTYNFNWDASKVASGIYFYQLEAGNYVSVKKMMLIK